MAYHVGMLLTRCCHERPLTKWSCVVLQNSHSTVIYYQRHWGKQIVRWTAASMPTCNTLAIRRWCYHGRSKSYNTFINTLRLKFSPAMHLIMWGIPLYIHVRNAMPTVFDIMLGIVIMLLSARWDVRFPLEPPDYPQQALSYNNSIIIIFVQSKQIWLVSNRFVFLI